MRRCFSNYAHDSYAELRRFVGRSLSTDDLTLESLKEEGYAAVFIGIGNPEPKTLPMFAGLSEEMGYFTSKGFLPKVSLASKAGMGCGGGGCKPQLPQLWGTVIVLGKNRQYNVYCQLSIN